MDSMIKETNESLRTIVNGLKESLDASINTLENIQLQMDKKVEEAKRYKIEVDETKEKISVLEEENKSLDQSLKELSEKYSKMNLVSIIEAGNKEIKAKININITEINKLKSHIAELTNKARTIKDLLLNLKKDKTVKETKLENLRTAYEYYNTKITEIIDYALNHANNLMDFKTTEPSINEEFDNTAIEYNDSELENTMVFDEIANIDENKNFKDEMSFITDQINENINSDNEEDLNYIDNLDNEEEDENKEYKDEDDFSSDYLNETDIKDTSFEPDLNENTDTPLSPENDVQENNNNDDENNNEVENSKENNLDLSFDSIDTLPPIESDNLSIKNLLNDEQLNNDEQVNKDSDKDDDEDTNNRLNDINDLFTSINQVPEKPTVSEDNLNIEQKIDNAYEEVFGKSLENKNSVTLTDIFGNPIKEENLNQSNEQKPIESLLVDYGIDFNKFKEDEQNYLKQIYNEEKFIGILDTLKRNKINMDNIYSAFNIFGELSSNELENLITKLVLAGQSIEAIGLILEKLPKIKKYDLDGAIYSYGDYAKDIDITELIIKAKELYESGGNI